MEAGQNTSLPEQGKVHMTGYRTFRVQPYAERYVSDDHTELWERLDQLYSIVQAYKTNFNKANWTDCCYTFERTKFMGKLGHPACSTRDIKDLIHQENLHSLEEFRQFMLRVLPKNDVGLIRMPQVNMKHGIFKEEADSSSRHDDEAILPEKQEAKPSQRAEEVSNQNKPSKTQKLTEDISALRVETDRLKVPSIDLV